MKLRVPSGCGAASHQGRAIDIDADGCVEVEEEAARALAAHGFTLCEVDAVRAAPPSQGTDPLGDDIDGLNRRELFAFLKAKGVSVCLPITNEELRALARRAARDVPDDENEGS
jgi:hypothetical protein